MKVLSAAPAPGLHGFGHEKTGNSVKILIADSEMAFRRFIRRTLEAQTDLRVVGEAGDTKEILRLAELLKPDVVLMDMDLQDGGSLDATLQLKARWPKMRVIILSVLTGEAYRRAAGKYGADAFVSKSGPISAIIAAIRQRKPPQAA